jgi:hypothetical protein
MRRLTGLLTSLLLFHLTLVGADLTCAKHGVQGAAHADTSPHAEHHAPPRPAETGHDDTSCEVPTVPACCQALASCGLSLVGNPSAESGDLSHLAPGVLSAADDTPTSWTLEPDPPPPKA